MPGLWDNHVHFGGGEALIDENRNLLPLYLAHGITTVRDAAGDLSPSVLEWRGQVADGTLLGPTIYTSGPKLEGIDSIWPGDLEVGSEADVRAALDQLQAMRVDFVKITENTLSRALYLFGLGRGPAPRLHGVGARPGRAHARPGVRGRARLDRAHVVSAARRLAARGGTERRGGRRPDAGRPTR